MRIDDKIKEIEAYLKELINIMPYDLDEYKDIKTRAACERYFEKIIVAIIDLSFLIIRDKNLKIPEEEKEVFDILSTEKIISEELATKFKEAKGMRNLIVHQYGNIDDEIVFNSLTKELEKDIREFIKFVKKIK